MVLQRSTEVNVLTNKSTGILLLSIDLSYKDKVILLSHIVNAAQLLLRQQFPQLPGLQDVSLGQTMAFNVCAGEFVQIFCHINYTFSPIQSGTYDCGLFSIAYTTLMAFRVDPCQIKVGTYISAL